VSDAICENRNIPSTDRSTVVNSLRAPAFLTFHNLTTDTVLRVFLCDGRYFVCHNKCSFHVFETKTVVLVKLVAARGIDTVKYEKYTDNKRKHFAYSAVVEKPPSKTTSSRSGDVVSMSNKYTPHDNRVMTRSN